MLSFKEIKQLQKSKKARDTQGLFVTEGRKLFEEAPADRIAQVVVSRAFMEKYPDVLDRLPAGVPASVGLTDERFARIADTKTPQGILTVVRKMEFMNPFAQDPAEKSSLFSPGDHGIRKKAAESSGAFSEGDVRREQDAGEAGDKAVCASDSIGQDNIRNAGGAAERDMHGTDGLSAGNLHRDRHAREQGSGLYLILEKLQDPGNAGTILRTAEAAGVTAVYLTEGSADLYAPKTIRSTMGSIYRVPHFYVASAGELIYNMKHAGVKTYAAHLRGEKLYTGFDYRGPSAFVIGNEGNGITDETASACDALMRIPMCGKVESLNAAMAAGILMYEAARQRRE